MNTNDLDEFAKPRKVRKQKVHRQPVFFDDDMDEVRNRKQAGKKKHSRNFGVVNEMDFDDDEELEQYKPFLR
jgi:hypothetical protein